MHRGRIRWSIQGPSGVGATLLVVALLGALPSAGLLQGEAVAQTPQARRQIQRAQRDGAQFWSELQDAQHRLWSQHRRRGWDAVARGRLDVAAASAEAMLRERPEDAEGHCLRGVVHQGQGQSAEAMVHFDRAAAIDGDSHCRTLGEGIPNIDAPGRVVKAKAKALMVLRRWDDARQWLGARVPLLSASQRRSDAYEALGDLHQLRGEAGIAEARRAYRYAERGLGMALLLHRQGQHHAACRIAGETRQQVRARNLERFSSLPAVEVLARRALAAQCAGSQETRGLWEQALGDAGAEGWLWAHHARQQLESSASP